MKKLWSILSLLLVSSLAHAQAPSAFPYAKPIPNDATTGTTQFTLTKINASGNALIMAITDTAGYSGVCVANCGKTGTAWIVFAGLTPVTMENTATALHYVTIGSSTAGNGHDSGATTYPTTTGDVIGRIQVGAASTAQAMVDLFPPEISSPGVATFYTSPDYAGSAVSVAVANTIYVWTQTFPTSGLSAKGMCTRNVTADNSNLYDVGFYTLAGTLIAHWGAKNLPNGPGDNCFAIAGGPIVLAGEVLEAITGNATTATFRTSAEGSSYLRCPNGSSSVTASAGGVLPASITAPACATAAITTLAAQSVGAPTIVIGNP